MLGSNSIISVKRLQTVGGKSSYSGADIYTGVCAFIERVDPKIAAILDSPAVFETYNCFVPEGFDIRIKDQIIDDQGNLYNVQGVAPYVNNTEIGALSNHSELTVVKQY